MKIEVKNVTKEFKRNIVLKDVNLTLKSGYIYGLQGRNGSGKTVLLKILCGFFKPNAGLVTYDGVKLNGDIYKYNVGALIENPKFFPDLSGYNNLKILAEIRNKIGEKEINEVLNWLDLSKDKDKKVSKYSLGMRQKLGIAQAIMEEPDIIFLDEPFNGIEEKTVKVIKEYLLQAKKEGKLIVISSHIKEDLEELADEIFIFKDGTIS